MRQIARWMWQHHKGCRMRAVLNAVIGLSLVALGLFSVDTIRALTDIATGARPGSIGWMAALLAGIYVAEILLHIASTWVSAVLGVKTQNQLQQSFFNRLLHSRWGGVERYHSGDVLNRLVTDINDIVSLMTEVLPSVLIVTAQFVASFCYLYMMDSTLAVILVAISPLFAVLSRIYMIKMRSIVRQIKTSNSAVQSVIQESIQRAMLIKTLERIDTMVQRLSGTHSLLQKQIKQRARFSILSNLFVNVGFVGAFLCALVWGMYQLQQGLITMGVLIAFTQLINRIQRPILDLAHLLPVFVNSIASAERLMELEEVPTEDSDAPCTVDGMVGMRFDHVCFRYDKEEGRSGRVVISDFCHDFRPGSFTAIVGETGAGKTTLLRMMLALIQPGSGSVMMYAQTESGQILSSEPIGPNHRHLISYIPQGNTLFSGTIRENLLLGKPDATDAELQEALHTACADFVMELELGLDTPCTEQGGGLSEGQAQRIAIARALLRPCRIMLLDEATSALDAETERQLLCNLQTYFADRTIIFITHRPAVTKFATDIVRLVRVEDR